MSYRWAPPIASSINNIPPLAAGISLGNYLEHVGGAGEHPGLSETVLLSWPVILDTPDL
jgi:hypothetical protein